MNSSCTNLPWTVIISFRGTLIVEWKGLFLISWIPDANRLLFKTGNSIWRRSIIMFKFDFSWYCKHRIVVAIVHVRRTLQGLWFYLFFCVSFKKSHLNLQTLYYNIFKYYVAQSNNQAPLKATFTCWTLGLEICTGTWIFHDILQRPISNEDVKKVNGCYLEKS